jgi:hypothetical protein
VLSAVAALGGTWGARQVAHRRRATRIRSQARGELRAWAARARAVLLAGDGTPAELSDEMLARIRSCLGTQLAQLARECDAMLRGYRESLACRDGWSAAERGRLVAAVGDRLARLEDAVAR